MSGDIVAHWRPSPSLRSGFLRLPCPRRCSRSGRERNEKSKRISAFQDYVTCVNPHKAFPQNSRNIQQRTRLDSNQRPSVSKTDALSQEPLKNKAHLNAAKRERAVARAVEMESDAQSSPADPDLIAVIASWATLPAAIKVGIMAMVGATTPS